VIALLHFTGADIQELLIKKFPTFEGYLILSQPSSEFKEKRGYESPLLVHPDIKLSKTSLIMALDDLPDPKYFTIGIKKRHQIFMTAGKESAVEETLD